jgi:hypothetical protein
MPSEIVQPKSKDKVSDCSAQYHLTPISTWDEIEDQVKCFC